MPFALIVVAFGCCICVAGGRWQVAGGRLQVAGGGVTGVAGGW